MKRPFFIIILLAGLILPAAAQSVTYNADERKVIPPHPAAGVTLHSKSKGLLLPKVNRTTRLGLSLNADDMGLTVYQTDSVKGIYEWDGLAWRCLNPLEISDDSGMVRQLAKVAISGRYLDLSDRPNIPQSINDLSEVAFTGNYNDLADRPRIPDLPASPDGRPQNFATVALTGDYLDLKERPRIPQRLDDLSEAAFSGNYNDLEDPIPLPTALSDLEPDEDHQTIEADEAAEWDELAAMSVPTKLTQLETDYNTNLVSEKEIQTWNGIGTRDLPRRLSELKQNEFFRTVSKTDKDKWEADAARIYPTMLRDLEQDAGHLIVTEREKAEWDAAAERLSFSGRYDEIADRPQLHSVAITGSYGSLSTKLPIPTDLSEFERNEYYSLVTLSEWEKWHRKSEFKGSYHDLVDTPRIARRIADLKDDYEAMTVSNNDINFWNNMAAVMDSSSWFSGSYSDLKDKPRIPSALSDLTQDTAAMTVSATYTPAGERQQWDEMSEKRNGAGIFVSDYETDDLHLTVSYADTATWNTDARRIIPDSLRHLTLDDGMQWVSDSLRRRWQAMTDTYIISDDTIANLQSMTSTVTQQSPTWFAGAETLKNTMTRYTGISASLLPVAYTGDYLDLTATPDQLVLLDSATLAPLSHIAKVATDARQQYTWLDDVPFLALVSENGDYQKLTEKPKLATVATSGNYDDLSGLPTTTTGDLLGGFAKDRSGNRTGFTLKEDLMLKGTTTVSSGYLKVGQADDGWGSSGLGGLTDCSIEAKYNIKIGQKANTSPADTATAADYLSTVTSEKELNAQWMDSAKRYAKEIVIPEGMVIMWYGSGQIPPCWKRVTAMQGHFPVGIDDINYSKGMDGDIGKEQITLTSEQMPNHNHVIDFDFDTYTDGGAWCVGGSGTDAHWETQYIEDAKPHENRPPFYAIYFIQRDNANCPN